MTQNTQAVEALLYKLTTASRVPVPDDEHIVTQESSDACNAAYLVREQNMKGAPNYPHEAFRSGWFCRERLAAQRVPVASEPIGEVYVGGAVNRDGFSIHWAEGHQFTDGIHKLYTTPQPLTPVPGWVTGLDGVSRPNPAAGAPQPKNHKPFA